MQSLILVVHIIEVKAEKLKSGFVETGPSNNEAFRPRMGFSTDGPSYFCILVEEEVFIYLRKTENLRSKNFYLLVISFSGLKSFYWFLEY